MKLGWEHMNSIRFADFCGCGMSFRGLSCRAEQLLARQEGLCFTELTRFSSHPTRLSCPVYLILRDLIIRRLYVTVFALSNAGIVGSNPTQAMDVCVYSVYVVLCR
jgi:hypothetical protein